MVKDILTTRFNAKHWDQTKEIPPSVIDYVTDCIQKSPSKMSLLSYKVIIITNSEVGTKLKNWLFYDHTWNFNGDRTPDTADSVGRRDYNGQYLAPVLIAWLNPIESPDVGTVNDQRVIFPDFSMRQNNIFVSNAIAMMAAEEQGLNTGFGSCHDHAELAKKLGFLHHSCPIVLGIGYGTDMSKDITNDNYLIPVTRFDNEANKLGTCLVNLPAHYEKPNRLLRPSKEELITII